MSKLIANYKEIEKSEIEAEYSDIPRGSYFTDEQKPEMTLAIVDNEIVWVCDSDNMYQRHMNWEQEWQNADYDAQAFETEEAMLEAIADMQPDYDAEYITYDTAREIASLIGWVVSSEQRKQENYDNALDEFNHIASHTEGLNGCSWNSSNGFEFIIWIEKDDPPPEPESELIEIVVTHDDYCDGRYKFEMTLPYE